MPDNPLSYPANDISDSILNNLKQRVFGKQPYNPLGPFGGSIQDLLAALGQNGPVHGPSFTNNNDNLSARFQPAMNDLMRQRKLPKLEVIPGGLDNMLGKTTGGSGPRGLKDLE